MKRSLSLFIALLLLSGSAFAQETPDLLETSDIQYFRPPGQEGINKFEAPKVAGADFDGLAVHVGGDFAIQFQGISQSNDADNLVDLAPNFALPTANLNVDVQIASGMRMHLRTYLSSRNHTEAYVMGGYFQVDNLDFIQEGFLNEVMDMTRFRFGMSEYNYGDTHFRRSDNADVVYNPFVGNYLMDSFTTEPFAEVTVLNKGFIGVAGITNGRLNQSPALNPDPARRDNGVAVYGKLGYDTQVNENLRTRLTGSVYHSTADGARDYLYGGDRAGARYYDVLHTVEEGGSNFLPRFNPGFPYQTAFQINPFVKFQGLEFFGVFEQSIGRGEAEVGDEMVSRGSFTQLGGELLYRFGRDEDFYVGGRYNAVTGSQMESGADQEISRFNVGGGWFLTDNVLTKVEYVNQSYSGDGYANSLQFAGAEFNGVVLEAAISF